MGHAGMRHAWMSREWWGHHMHGGGITLDCTLRQSINAKTRRARHAAVRGGGIQGETFRSSPSLKKTVDRPDHPQRLKRKFGHSKPESVSE